MSKAAWKSFEQLVSRIEQTLGGEFVTVKSPDHIPCITTGTTREVDVSIRTRVGSAEILVTVECRDRATVQDVTWIEQLIAKKRNIGAAKTIAVAASGFSAEAARIARENAIDLRVLDQITDEDVKSWGPKGGLIHVFKDCGLTGSPEVLFFAEREDGPPESGSTAGPGALEAQQIFRGPNGESLSLNDIWLRVGDQLKVFEKVPKDDQDHFIELTVTPTDSLQLCTPNGNRRVKSINMPVRLRWKHEFIPLSDAIAHRYRPADPTDQFLEQVNLEFETKQSSSMNFRLDFLLQKCIGDTLIIRALVETVRAAPAARPIEF